VSNISGQKVTLKITTKTGDQVEDFLEEGEIVYGLNENAAVQLRMYEYLGLIKIDETDEEHPKVRWLVEGF
jgi:hypothetical protein